MCLPLLAAACGGEERSASTGQLTAAQYRAASSRLCRELGADVAALPDRGRLDSAREVEKVDQRWRLIADKYVGAFTALTPEDDYREQAHAWLDAVLDSVDAVGDYFDVSRTGPPAKVEDALLRVAQVVDSSNSLAQGLGMTDCVSPYPRTGY